VVRRQPIITEPFGGDIIGGFCTRLGHQKIPVISAA
jgi:hypothetical protein